MEDHNFLIGQRVVMTSMTKQKELVDEIGTVVVSETGHTSFGVWVYSPVKGYASDYSPSSVEPLPNGQL